MYPFELDFAHRDIQKEEYDCYNHHQIPWIKTLLYTRDEPFENFIGLCVSQLHGCTVSRSRQRLHKSDSVGVVEHIVLIGIREGFVERIGIDDRTACVESLHRHPIDAGIFCN